MTGQRELDAQVMDETNDKSRLQQRLAGLRSYTIASQFEKD